MPVHYMLDTHAVLWHLGDSSRLSRSAAKAIQQGEITISVAVYWEVVIKARKGLLDIADPVKWWRQAVARLGCSVISIRESHVAAVAGLATYHNDPFDRIMIAQCLEEGFCLITNDPLIRRYPVQALW